MAKRKNDTIEIRRTRSQEVGGKVTATILQAGIG
jgi:hypothetical protein